MESPNAIPALATVKNAPNASKKKPQIKKPKDNDNEASRSEPTFSYQSHTYACTEKEQKILEQQLQVLNATEFAQLFEAFGLSKLDDDSKN